MTIYNTRQDRKQKAEIETLLSNRARLTDDQKQFILDNYSPPMWPAPYDAAALGAYFTPQSIAREVAFICGDGDSISKHWRVLDLCAGIGSLAYALHASCQFPPHITAIDVVTAHVSIGERILPEANWICNDAYNLDVQKKLGKFDMVISNPPYGLKTKAPFFERSHFAAIEIALSLAPAALFLLPRDSVPFVDSGIAFHRELIDLPRLLSKFMKAHPDIVFDSTSMDLSMHANDWSGGTAKVELVYLHR